MLRAFRSPTVPATDSRLGTNVRRPRRRLLKEWTGQADPTGVTRGLRSRIRALSPSGIRALSRNRIRALSQSRTRALSVSEKGFTLIEVLVSALVVTLIAAAVAEGLMTNIKVTADQHRRNEAQMLAEQDQERLKGLSAEQLDNLSQTYNATYDGYKFKVQSQAWYLSSTNGAACSSGAGATSFKTISTVSWTDPTNTDHILATDESVIAPDAGGSILAQFHDQTTAPLAGVSVAATLTSPVESDSATSDANGCTIFTGLPTGTYNLTFTDAGYVDPNGNASPISDTANVASTGIATPSRGNPIELGQAGGVTGDFYIDNGGAPGPAFSSGSLSWYGSGSGYSMSNSRTRTVSTPATSLQTTTVAGASGSGLFPFASSLNPASYTNNYQLWAGTCRAEEPPAGKDEASVTPGYSGSIPVTEPEIDVNATYLNNRGQTSPVTPNDVKITFNATSGNTCSDTWAYSSSSTPPYTADTSQGANHYEFAAPFATGATSGSTASASGQTGNFTVCADYTTGGKTYKAYALTSGGATATYTDQYGTLTSIPTIAIKYASTASGAC
jgi:prepilin-type N-terminal cleavage/methylation domain-containing protein